jgi:phosphoribosyl 1,2-cyclic phosphodiesterase
MKAVFWGVRGSIPTPGRSTVEFGGNTTCLEVIANNGDEYIFDAGSGIRELGNDFMSRYKGKVNAKIFISHTHWDHIQGFPFFVPIFIPGNKFEVYSGDKDLAEKLSHQENKALTRTFLKKDLEEKLSELSILPRECSEKKLSEPIPSSECSKDKVKEKTRVTNRSKESNHTKRIFEGQQSVEERRYFPVSIDEMNAELTFCDLKEYEILDKGIKVSYMYHNRHKGGMFAYKIQEAEKRLVNIGDYEQDGKLDEATRLYTPGLWDNKIIAWAKGADAFIADVQYTYEEYLKRINWGHSYIEAMCTVAHLAGVKKVYFAHHDPMHNDKVLSELEQYAKKYMKETLKSNTEVIYAREGMSAEV